MIERPVCPLCRRASGLIECFWCGRPYRSREVVEAVGDATWKEKLMGKLLKVAAVVGAVATVAVGAYKVYKLLKG